MKKFELPHWHDELHLESMVAEQDFNNLLEDAIDSCLSSHAQYNLAYAETEQKTSQPAKEEERVVRDLGVWGLRTAFDISRYPNEFNKMTAYPTEEGDEELMYLGADTAIKSPRSFNFTRLPHTVAKIEAFGKALLNESFQVLGDDAALKADELREAKDPDKEWEIITWLINRIHDIHRAARGEEIDAEEANAELNSEQLFYHPLQLSPKAMGKFPDIDIDPTCLGVSVLASAFFEKSEMPHMHAGLIISDDNDARIKYLDTLGDAKEIVKTLGIELPELIKEKVSTAIKELRSALVLDQGHHALNYVRMSDGRWCQIDINFSSFYVFNKEDSEHFDATFKILQEMQHAAPGLELSHNSGSNSTALLPGILLRNGLEHSKSWDVIKEELNHLRDDTTVEDLIDLYVTPIFFGESKKSYVQSIQKNLWNYLNGIWCPHENEECPFTDEYYQIISQQAVLEYVFPDAKDGDITPCLKRCKQDKAYAARRVEDLKLLPLIISIKMTGDLCNATLQDKFLVPHSSTEVGMGAYRIGASVLSDFSAHFNALPPSFWLTYWPSHVSVVEHIQQPITKASRNVVHDHAGALAHWDMVNPVIHDIINKFLEQETTPEGEDNSGSDRE